MLVYSAGDPAEILKTNPVLDQAATSDFVSRMFRFEKITPAGNGDLSFTSPADNQVFAGCFPGLTIVAAKEFGIDFPSRLSTRFVDACPGRLLYLHAMHSAADWFAYAVWDGYKLKRTLSLSPDSGILENFGAKMAFEEPYWKGERPALDPEDDQEDDYPLPFHPIDMADAALRSLFGYQLEGVVDPTLADAHKIGLMHFTRKKPWWRRFK